MTRTLFIIFLTLLPYSIHAQCIMWYNVENLFDTQKDSIKNDSDFTPEGSYHWTGKKLSTKLINLSIAISAVGEGIPPAIIGMAEVENDAVLTQLVKYSPLSKYRYKFIHYESPDSRGIDLAMLYQPDIFKPIYHKNIAITNPNDSKFATRDILYVKGEINGDTLHILLNHWPSKRGGQAYSEHNRTIAALTLRRQVDSLWAIHTSPNILIMGDFNDEPNGKSLVEDLHSIIDYTQIENHKLYYIPPIIQDKNVKGTYKYQANWNTIDQFIVSGNLINNNSLLKIQNGICHICTVPILLEDDATHLGKKPKRTYLGPRYLGGISDHLPIHLFLTK